MAAAFLVASGLELAAYRPQIIAQVERATGRAFEIEEQLRLGFRKGLVVHATDMTVGNADWGSEPTMLRVKQAELRLALLPLLKGEFRIEHAAFDGLDLVLEMDESGRGNWEFDGGGHGGNTVIDVASVSVESGSVKWLGAPTSGNEPAFLSNISLDARDDGQSLVLTADAQVFDELVQLNGHVASPRTWKNGQPLYVNVRLIGEAGSFQIKGTVNGTSGGVVPKLSVTAKDLDVAMLADLLGFDAPQFPAIDTTLVLTRLNEAWIVDLQNIKAGSSDLAGSLQLESLAGKSRISGTLSAKRIEFGELFPRMEQTSELDAPNRRIFSSTPIDLTFLDNLEMALTLRAARLGTPKQSFNDAQLEAEAQQGQLKLRVHGASVEGMGKLRGMLIVDNDGKFPSWSMNLGLTRYPASALQRAAAITAIDAPVDLTLDLKARGASPQQMVNSLSGKARISAGRGRAQLKTIDSFVGGVTTVAGQLFEEGKNDTQLNCAIGDLKVRNGVVTTQVALVDSEAATLRIDGTVDLGREKLDLTVTPRPKKPTLTVAVPIHVRGPLRTPEFEPDRTSSFAKLIGIGSLLVYPPAAVVALGDLGDTGNACSKMIDRRGVPRQKKRSPARRVAEGIGGAANAIGMGIKRLFGD